MKTTSTDKPFSVYVDDNFHFMDESHRYKYGDYETYEEAVAVCKAIVDDFLPSTCGEGDTAKKLRQVYLTFGEDPFVVPTPDNRDFSVWDYVRQRCDEICKGS